MWPGIDSRPGMAVVLLVGHDYLFMTFKVTT